MKWFRAGDIVGRLTIIRFIKHATCGMKMWLVQCECGTEEVRLSSNIRRAARKNTGCSVCGRKKCDEARKTHGEANSVLHKKWMRMRARCHCPTSTNYRWYGGKGIKICAEWNDFIVFRDWAMANGYKEGLTIDRVDPCGNYCPENCRFISWSENSRLTREYHNKGK